jgi:hypothetical protein
VAITFPASGSVVTADTFAITTSGSVVSGDLLIFQVAFNDINDEPAPPTGPGSGEARIDSGTFYFHSSPAHQSYWYTAVAAGPSETYTWAPFNDGNHMNITYVAVRGCSTTLEDHNGATHGTANTNHTSDSVTAVDTTRMLLLMVGVTSQPTNDISATGFTQLIDTQDVNGTTNVEIYAGHKTAAAGAQTASFTLNTEAEKACSMLFVLAPAAGGPIVGNLGILSETDTIQPMGRRHARAIGQLAETDTVQPMGRRHARAIGQLADTSSIQPMGRRHARALGILAETDVIQFLNRLKRRTLGQLTEADSMLSLGRTRSKILGLLQETNSTQQMTRRHSRTLGLLSSSDSMLALGDVLTSPLGILTSTDSILPMGRRKVRTLGLLSEVDYLLGLDLPAVTIVEPDLVVRSGLSVTTVTTAPTLLTLRTGSNETVVTTSE